MVKGNSRQVILVNSPDQKLFDQAIFILKEEAVLRGVTDELLLKEADRVLRSSKGGSKRRKWFPGPLWAAAGAAITGGLWLLSTVF